MIPTTSAFWLLVPLLVVRAQAAELYRLDPANTRVSVQVRLFGLPWISAHFDDLSGALVSDHGSAASRVDVTVRTASLRCEDARWNARLLSAQWFDASRYPQIVYASDHIRFDAQGGASVGGLLTLHGRTRSVELTVDQWDCAETGRPQDACNFDARARIRRSDFGLPHGLLVGGDEVEIIIRGVAPKAVNAAL